MYTGMIMAFFEHLGHQPPTRSGPAVRHSGNRRWPCSTCWRLHIPVGAINTPPTGSLPGIARSLDWGLIDPSWCDTARSLRVFPHPPLRSIVGARANTRLTDWIRSPGDFATRSANSQAASFCLFSSGRIT